MRFAKLILIGLAATTVVAGCSRHKEAPAATAEDVDRAQAAAQKEIADAKLEASKDIKSASKVSSQDVAEAKITGQFDVAMAKADGEHTIANEKCLTLPAAQQSACKDQADADYETAKASAKAARLARMK